MIDRIKGFSQVEENSNGDFIVVNGMRDFILNII